MSFNIAVDGPAGAGKSTIAKIVAKRMNLIYVDTGAMYRAMALFMIREHINANDLDEMNERCEKADITIKYEDGQQVVYLNGENVNAYLRTEEVGNMASVSSTQVNVRKKLVNLQKKLAETSDVIMDGRDIGTCVLPNANVKIYLTSDAHVRAERRFLELKEKGIACDIDTIEKDIMERDERDMTRKESPLRKADDAILVDSSDMSIDEVVDTIISIIREKE